MPTNTERLELRRKRMAESPPILRGGFRPFFLGAAVWAMLALAGWLTFLFAPVFSDLVPNPLAWHRHEMVFGFAGAAIAGFALTAVPNWTGRLPIAGAPLAALFAAWLAGRLLPVILPDRGVVLAIVDGGFYLALAGLLGREVVLSKNRNLPVIAIIASFGLADMLDRLEMSGLVEIRESGWRGGFALVVLLITVVGGRIIPSFTRNWLAAAGAKQPLPTQADNFDKAMLALGLMALVTWLAAPMTTVASLFLLLAGFGHMARLARWQGWRCARDSLVLILHVGYAWVAIGFVLLGLAQSGIIPQSAGVHALSIGAMATMVLAVMSRASLGHTGRALVAGHALRVAYLLITLAATVRVLAALGVGKDQMMLLIAGLAWFGAYGLFLVQYAPILGSPRVDGLHGGR